MIECGAGQCPSVSWLWQGKTWTSYGKRSKSQKLCGTLPSLEVLSSLWYPTSRWPYLQVLSWPSESTAYPKFCNIVAKKHQKLFAQHIADRLGCKIILQHMHVCYEVGLNIFSYLSGDDVVAFRRFPQALVFNSVPLDGVIRIIGGHPS